MNGLSKEAMEEIFITKIVEFDRNLLRKRMEAEHLKI